MLFATLAVCFLPHAAEAGLPRDGGLIRLKYRTKVVTGITVGTWTSWNWTSFKPGCPKGQWWNDYTRWRPIIETYWTVERWRAWAWLDNNIIIYETPRLWSGPFTYTVWQRQRIWVLKILPQAWDSVWSRYGYDQIFYRDNIIMANWTQIDEIPGVLNHTVYVDEVPLYRYTSVPKEPVPFSDLMALDLGTLPPGGHTIRVKAGLKDGTVDPNFFVLHFTSMSAVEQFCGLEVLNVTRGTSASFKVRVRNNLDEARAVYFRVSDYDRLRWDIDVIGNGTVIPPGDSFFDVFVYAQPHTPIGETIDVEIVAMTLEGLLSFFDVSYPAPAGHLSSVKFRARVVAGSPTITVEPTVVFPSKNVTVRGYGFTPNSTVGVAFSAMDGIVANVNTGATGNFTAYLYVPSGLAYGVYAVAAIDGNGNVAVANLTVSVDVEALRYIPPLDVKLDVGSIHFRGEVAEFYVLTSFNGTRVNATINYATLYYSNGTLQADLTANVVRIGTGLYRVPYTLPIKATEGMYVLVVDARYVTPTVESQGTSFKGFLVSPTLTQWNAWLTSIKDDVGIIRTDVGTIKVDVAAIKPVIMKIDADVVTLKTDVGTIKADVTLIKTLLTNMNATITSLITNAKGEVLAAISAGKTTILAKLDALNATLIAVKGDVALIKTDVGVINADVAAIKPVIMKIDADVVTLKTDVGTIKADVAIIKPTLSRVEGDVATIKTQVGVINGTVTDIKGDVLTVKTDAGTIKLRVEELRTIIGLVWSGSGDVLLSLIAAIGAVASTALLLRKKYPKA